MNRRIAGGFGEVLNDETIVALHHVVARFVKHMGGPEQQ
jgi:hypothetical protein